MELLSSVLFVEPANSEAPSNNSELPSKVMSIAEFDQLFNDIISGAVTDADFVRQHFERSVSDYDILEVELLKLKKEQLFKRIAGYYRTTDKKDYLVRLALSTMISRYGFLTITGDLLSNNGYGKQAEIDNNRSRLARLNSEMIEKYRQKHLEKIEDHRRQIAAITESIKDPQTLEQFQTFFKYKGKDKLTPEQQLRYDSLIAEKLKKVNEAKLAAAAKIEGTSVDAEVVLVKTKHTRERHDLYVVRLDRRVEREEYNRLNIICKRLGGYYSSYRGNGATPGFQFKEEEKAQLFMKACHGESLDILDIVKERQQHKQESAAERLMDLGERSEDRAQDVLSQDRKTNTARRASQASSIESRARNDLALAQTVQNVAQAMSEGELEHLNGARHKSQVELLNAILKRAKDKELTKECPRYSDRVKREGEPITLETVFYVDYPRYYIDDSNLVSIANAISKVKGMKLLANRLLKVNSQRQLNSNLVIREELLDDICARAGDNNRLIPDSWIGTYADRKRLRRMGIDTPEQLRMACREIIGELAEKQKADAATELERKLIGQKVGIDFFPTPSSLARRMVETATSLQSSRVLEPAPDHLLRFLEPHAGNGNIATEIRIAGFEPDVCEISSCLREVLVAKNIHLVGWDFLELKDREYDCIIANPPFSNNQDIYHTRHAHSLLAPKGCLVTIVGEGAFSRTGQTESAFQEWLESIGAEVEPLPEDTFTDDKLMVNTRARARLVTIVR